MVYHNDILLSLKWKIAIDYFSWGSSGRKNNENEKNKNKNTYIHTYIHKS
jgi:hypothetical protein